MKRILGFLIGVGLGIILFYAIRKFTSKPATATPLPTPPPVKEVESTASTPVTPERVTTKFTVRRTGPRPQAHIEDVVEVSSATGKSTEEVKVEPVAETKTEPVEVAAEAATPVTTETSKSTPDDFRIIYDIGEVVNGKLLQAGIISFEQLAGTPVERLSEISGFPTKRIERNAWIEQAKRLAAGLPIEDVIPSKENQPHE
jgi:predicted flap endonuclease-1-like 5' DNA nuclease